MPRPKLPEGAKSVRIELTMPPATLTMLDALVARGASGTRSGTVASLVLDAFVRAAPNIDRESWRRKKH